MIQLVENVENTVEQYPMCRSPAPTPLQQAAHDPTLLGGTFGFARIDFSENFSCDPEWQEQHSSRGNWKNCTPYIGDIASHE